MSGFVVCGTEVAKRRVAALAIVEALDVLEDGARRIGTRRPTAPVQEVEIQGREEALRHSVVPAVARSTETRANAVALEHPRVRLGRVLAEFKGSSQQLLTRGA